MRLKTVATGSSGNCHLLIADSGETLILDCGVPIKEIKKGLDWNIRNVVGCIVSHAHSDHSKSVKDFEAMGIPVFAPYRYDIGVKFKGRWKIRAFDLTDLNGNWTHTDANGEPCPIYGFLIEHPWMGRMLYITDCAFVKWRFKGVNHILLGVNYDLALLSGDDAKRNHVIRGHMSIDTACEFVKANASPDLQNVVMCHLSSENADPDSFIQKMRGVVPATCDVLVAIPGMELVLRKGDECPF